VNIGLSLPLPYLAAPGAPAAAQPTAPSDEGLGPREAMDVLERARKQPECVVAEQALAEARKRLQVADGAQVDQQAYINRSMSNFGCFALCGSLFASMFILSKSGLTGTGAMIGLAVGFLLVPATAMWLVKKHGMTQAKDKLRELEQTKTQCAADVNRRQGVYDNTLHSAVDRLYREAQANPDREKPDPNGSVSATETQVQLGGIVVNRRK